MVKKTGNKKLNNTSMDIANNINTDADGNPYKIGDIVLASAGRDENRLFVVVGILDKDYVLIANGRSRRVDFPKKKKVRHIKPAAAGDFKLKDLKDGKFTNLIIKNIIAEYIKNSIKINNLK
ncbi:MAG: KOW domain-containing RNA-binding protein [Oscillospiraceae bacterium]|nr:KOW domain-containing RNA-binding protein [Oscillospiraceae bacterium]